MNFAATSCGTQSVPRSGPAIHAASPSSVPNTGLIGDPSDTVSHNCQPSPAGGPFGSHVSLSARCPWYFSTEPWPPHVAHVPHTVASSPAASMSFLTVPVAHRGCGARRDGVGDVRDVRRPPHRRVEPRSLDELPERSGARTVRGVGGMLRTLTVQAGHELEDVLRRAQHPRVL